MHGASGKRHRVVVVVVVLLSLRVPRPHLLGGKDEQDLGKKSRGGRCPRGLIEGVFQTNTGTWSPRFVRHACVVKMNVSGAHAIDPELSRNPPTLNPKFPRRNKWGYVAPISIRKITDLSS